MPTIDLAHYSVGPTVLKSLDINPMSEQLLSDIVMQSKMIAQTKSIFGSPAKLKITSAPRQSTADKIALLSSIYRMITGLKIDDHYTTLYRLAGGGPSSTDDRLVSYTDYQTRLEAVLAENKVPGEAILLSDELAAVTIILANAEKSAEESKALS